MEFLAEFDAYNENDRAVRKTCSNMSKSRCAASKVFALFERNFMTETYFVGLRTVMNRG